MKRQRKQWKPVEADEYEYRSLSHLFEEGAKILLKKTTHKTFREKQEPL